MRAFMGLAAGVAIAVLAGAAARAENQVVVIELYTSQGCSSCPPADELFAELARRGDLLPLALHVDYWDYIGWVDSFAQPAFTERQKAYARAVRSRTIYTPQMVVGGADHVVGTQEMELAMLIEKHRARARTVRLGLDRRGDSIELHAEALAALPRTVLVQLVRYLPQETVEIHRGENAGRTITYSNIVTEWRQVGRWNGDGPLSLTLEAPGSQPAAVILQEEGPGAIVAAAALR